MSEKQLRLLYVGSHVSDDGFTLEESGKCCKAAGLFDHEPQSSVEIR